MSLTENEMKPLRNWLKKDSAMSSHTLDSRRFHQFVAAVWIGRKHWLECHQFDEEICYLCEQLHPEWGTKVVKKFIEKKMSEATMILQFLDTMQTKKLLSLLE